VLYQLSYAHHAEKVSVRESTAKVSSGEFLQN